MDPIEKFLHSISYKFPKGYPDINNPKDMDLLNNLLLEFIGPVSSELNEQSDSEQMKYDDTIRKALGLEVSPPAPLPIPKGNYSVQSNTFEGKVDSKDKEIFDKLYNTAPPKKGETTGETKGVGNGEVALYWLFKYSPNNIDVNIGRHGDDPDLIFNNSVGIEIKSYSKHGGKHQLGRFGQDKENLYLLSIIFGIKALSETLGKMKNSPSLNPTNFKGTDLENAFEQVFDLARIPALDELASQYKIFELIKQNIQSLNTELNSPKTPKEAALNMAHKIIGSKLGRKPGDNGYLVNILKNGDYKFFHVNMEKMKSHDDILDDFEVKQSTIHLNFDKIFS